MSNTEERKDIYLFLDPLAPSCKGDPKKPVSLILRQKYPMQSTRMEAEFALYNMEIQRERMQKEIDAAYQKGLHEGMKIGIADGISLFQTL